MIRYLRQRDRTTCGPIAVINALKWAGVKATEKTHKKKIQRLTNCRSHGRGYNGCFPFDINYALLQYKSIKICKVYDGTTWISLSEIDKHLDDGGSVLMRYFWAPGKGHYSICVSRTSKKYTFVNDSREKTVTFRSRKTMRKMLSTTNSTFCGCQEYPVVWFLTRK